MKYQAEWKAIVKCIPWLPSHAERCLCPERILDCRLLLHETLPVCVSHVLILAGRMHVVASRPAYQTVEPFMQDHNISGEQV